MTYSFKDDVIKNLPAGVSYVRMYAVSSFKTTIEGLKNNKSIMFSMDKLDLTTFFTRLPVIVVKQDSTYNDLYSSISDIYSLGLVKGIDYFNSDVINISNEVKYVELPITNDSYGYYGKIRCRIILEGYDIPNLSDVKDLSELDIGEFTKFNKLKSLMMTRIFSLKTPMFINDKITLSFTNLLIDSITDHFDLDYATTIEDNLIYSTVISAINDGLSDIVLLKLKDGSYLSIRFQSALQDLPVLNNGIINNDTSDSKTDTSEGVLVDDSSSVSENPGEKEGETNVTEETVIEDTVDDHPNSSSTDSSEVNIDDTEIELNLD